MSFGHIYKIVFPNGNHYIGLTQTSLKQRKRQHQSCAKNGNPNCLYNALRKYNMVDSFELIEIDTANTLEELCEKEIHHIEQYNSYYKDEKGYNMTRGGEGNNGYIFTEDDKQRISAAQKKRFEDPSEKEKSSKAAIKRFQNDDERMRQGERMKQRMIDNPELTEKFSKAQKKRFEDPTQKNKMSEMKKFFFKENPDVGKEHSERMKKKFENPKAKERMQKIAIQYWSNNETRIKQSQRTKLFYKENPEKGKEHGERMKNRFKNDPEARRKCSTKGEHKPFDVLKIDGTFIKTFTFQYEAKEFLEKEYSITSTIKIGEVLAGKRNTSAGFVFKYK